MARLLLQPDHGNHFALEDPVVAVLMANPMTLRAGLRGLVVVDEAQRAPGLFPVLGVLADRPGNPATFLVLGSASPELSRQSHPKLGASWEGFALEEILRTHRPDEAYFYAVHSSCELDLFMFVAGRRIGLEFKRADAAALTRSMRTAVSDLGLDELWVVYPGTRTYPLGENITVRPLKEYLLQ